jgi:carbon monoxide dehydrogenase subunit G
MAPSGEYHLAPERRIQDNAAMRCEYTTSQPGAADDVWRALTDVDRVLAALPGASLSRDGDSVSGGLTCRFTAGQATYRISARADADLGDDHSVVIAATGGQARGEGTLAATISVSVRPEESSNGAVTDGATVAVEADLTVTGRGEAADSHEWDRVLGRLVDAALRSAPPAVERVEESAPAVDQDGGAASSARTLAGSLPVSPARLVALGALTAFLALIWRRIFRRRRR